MTEHSVRRPSRRVALLGAATTTFVAGGAALAFAAAPAASAADAVCPTYDTGGFTVLVQGDASMGNHEIEGSLALGGDLSVTDSSALIHSSSLTPVDYTLPTVDGDPTRLLVGGTLDLSSPGTLQVTSAGHTSADQIGAMKFGDTDGLALVGRGDVDRLYAAGSSVDDHPYVDVNAEAGQTLDDAHAVTYPGAAATVEALYSPLLAQGQSLQDEAATSGAGVTGTGEGTVTLVPGVVNVLKVTAEQLSTYTDLEFDGTTPSATTPLVFDVTDASGTVTIPQLRGEGMPSPTNNDHPNPWSPYVTWNLTGAGTTTVTGELITGTILAPGVDLTADLNSPVEGQIIAKTLVTTGAGEIHNYQSAADCTPVTPTPTPTDTTTTPTPTPTDTTTTPPVSPTVTPTVTPTLTPTDGTSTAPVPLAPTTTSGGGLPETAPPVTPAATPSGGLAATGASLAPLAIGLLLVASGVVLLVVRRRIATR